MMEEITIEIFQHLVELAALELDDEQGEYIRGQLNNQLKAIHELEAIPLGDQNFMTLHGVHYAPEMKPELREDAWQPFPNPHVILSQAPQFEDGYLVVPDIPHTTLE